jgi:hypothetical protein
MRGHEGLLCLNALRFAGGPDTLAEKRLAFKGL